MKLAILETGRPPGDLAERFGDYPAMFERLLGPEFEIESFDVAGRRFPEPGEHDAYLITGSPAGVYDPLPWIGPLLDFIRAAKDSQMVGICFGHQVDGRGARRPGREIGQGLGRGLHRYPIVRPEPWMDDAASDRRARLAPGPGRRPAAATPRSSPRPDSRHMPRSPGPTGRRSRSSSTRNSRPPSPRR